MNRLANTYNRPKEEMTKYEFGFVKKDSQEVKLIHPRREHEPISSLIGVTDFFLYDLIIVPLSQIPPRSESSLFVTSAEEMDPGNLISRPESPARTPSRESKSKLRLREAQLAAQEISS